jgi:hypothetical protein
MHSNHATWETTLVIPEATKTVEEQTLDAVLRIEVLLEQLLGQRNVVTLSGPELDFDDEMNVIGTKKPAPKKAKAK